MIFYYIIDIDEQQSMSRGLIEWREMGEWDVDVIHRLQVGVPQRKEYQSRIEISKLTQGDHVCNQLEETL